MRCWASQREQEAAATARATERLKPLIKGDRGRASRPGLSFDYELCWTGEKIYLREGQPLQPMPLPGIGAHDRDPFDASRPDRSSSSSPRQLDERLGSPRRHYAGQVLLLGSQVS